jgi:DNA ligase-1
MTKKTMMAAMLAKKWSPKKVDYTGWFGSEKIDGYRALWDGQSLKTRNDNTYSAPASFTKHFPENMALDGELLIPGEGFEAHGALRRKDSSDHIWQKVRFYAFAMQDSGAPFSEVVRRMQRYDGNGPIIVLKQEKVGSNADAQERADAIIAEGGEGLMLREPSSVYAGKRSSDLVKIKVRDIAAAIIVGHTKGKGRNNARLGAYVCRFVEDEDTDDDRNLVETFNVGGVTDAERENPRALGEIVTVGYQNLTKNGKPRFPRLV